MKLNFKIFIILNIIFCLSIRTYSQNPKIDSLKLVDKNFKLNENYKTDTLYLYNANLLSFYYLRIYPDTAIILSKENIPLCEQADYIEGKAMALRHIGLGFKYLGDIDSSLFYIQKSYEEYSSIDNQLGMSKINFSLGSIYRIKGETELAIENYEKALIYFTKINNSQYISFTLNNIAIIYQMQGKLIEALEYYYKILTLFEDEDNKSGLASAYVNIGIVLEIQEKYDDALIIYEKSLEISTELNDYYAMANIMSNISNIYLIQEEYDKALLLINQTIIINKKSKNLIGEANNYLHLCKLYDLLENYDSIRVYTEKSKILNQGIGNKVMEFRILYYEASINYSENKIEKALEKALEAHNIITEIGDVERQLNISLLLYEIYETNNNYEKSLFYHKEYKLYSDSITRTENLKKTELMQAEYVYLKKENSLIQKQEKYLQKISKQKYTILIFVIALVSIFIILLLIYRKKQQKQRDYLLLQKKILK